MHRRIRQLLRRIVEIHVRAAKKTGSLQPGSIILVRRLKYSVMGAVCVAIMAAKLVAFWGGVSVLDGGDAVGGV